MEIFKQIAPLRAFLEDAKKSGKTVGLVPTMGALHQGHISLIEAAKAGNSLTVATIYVNPAQFNNAQDLKHYPKTLSQDIQMLENAGCDVLFSPDDDEMYAEKPLLQLEFGHLDQVMEGKFRPGHFSGVALVVSKLFNIVQPAKAYFGQKDWQQFTVIHQLVSELKFNIELFSVPIHRDPQGLAMSSRNLRLTEEERRQATVFHKALTTARQALGQGQDLQTVKKAVEDMVEKTPGMRLQYFELADRQSLTLLEHAESPDQAILCIAGYAGDVRLIDNMFLE